MFEPLEILKMANASAAHAATRQTVIAGNVANADTPGYRARDVEDFASFFQRLQPVTDGVARRQERNRVAAEIRTQLQKYFQDPRPGNLPEILTASAPVETAPNGNSVSLEVEMMRAVETRHQHEMALSVYRSVSGIIRTSLGR
jgi:flagellar basal-body rod protein FlgB